MNPSNPGSLQMYLTADASEVHYECFGIELVTSIRMNGISCYLYPNDLSYRSSFCWVNNNQHNLMRYFHEIDFRDVDALIKLHAEKDLQSKRERKNSASFGIYCTFYFVYESYT